MEIDTETMLSIFRGTERLFIVLAAFASITYGWNLFKTRILISQKAEFSAGDWTIKFASVGPGIFFALFGAYVLHVAVTNTFKLAQDTLLNNQPLSDDNRIFIEYARERTDKDNIFMTVKVLNSLLADLIEPQKFSNSERVESYRANLNQITTLRNQLVESKLGSKAFNLWKKFRNDYRAGNELPDEKTRKTLEDVEAWINATL